jgi:hypothetical protein
VVLADANPAIGALAVATMTPLADAGAVRDTASGEQLVPSEEVPGEPGSPQPNLGPPSARLDWRKR